MSPKRYKAFFRFYEELNDFLEPEFRKKRFEYHFNGSPAIKDAIEAIGVPHTEIDVILANDHSVGFDYRLLHGDRISVYPVFESLDVSTVTRLRPFPLRETRFVLDVHLGKLARLLRMLGFDALYRNDYHDPEIVDIGVGDKRIILTRDHMLLKANRVTHGYWVRSTAPREQAREVLRRFDLHGKIKPFHRCMVCNGVIEAVKKETVIDEMPAGVSRDYDEFYHCTSCGKVYWKGSHYDKLVRLVSELSSDRNERG